MSRAVFRFYAELNELLPRGGGPEVAYEFRGEPSVKDAIEAIGVPHTEVDLVLGGGEPVGFGWRLARYLRMAGFDVRWDARADDEELARVAVEEGRVLVTRDRGLLKRRGVAHGCCVRALDPERQLAEVARRFDLGPLAAPFRRCLVCNGDLSPVAKAAVSELLPPRVRERCHRFLRCGACGKVYWAGSHVRRMERLLAGALGRLPGRAGGTGSTRA